jgi:hypothetical protein
MHAKILAIEGVMRVNAHILNVRIRRNSHPGRFVFGESALGCNFWIIKSQYLLPALTVSLHV